MTGFGRGEAGGPERLWVAEVRTVNHRFLDQKITLPRAFPCFEEPARKMVAEQYERAKKILLAHREGHGELAQILMDREVIFADDVKKIFGERPWKSRADELTNENKTEE